MTKDSCIDYNYYNNPRFRLFGGPNLPSAIRELKNIQTQNIQDLPLPIQLAIGDLFTTDDIVKAYNKYQRAGNDIKALTIKERSLVRGLVKLDRKQAKANPNAIIPRDNLTNFLKSPELSKSLQTIKEYKPELGEAMTIRRETQLYVDKINEVDNWLKKKINDELDVSDEEVTTYIESLFKAQELENQYLDKEDELTYFAESNSGCLLYTSDAADE